MKSGVRPLVQSPSDTHRVRRAGPDFRWPNGAKAAVIFNIAYEGWSSGSPPAGDPAADPLAFVTTSGNAAPWGHYGAVRGIQRLLRIANKNRILTSIMTNGLLAEKWPW